MRLSSILWPRPQNLEEYWSSDAGAEFLDKWFSIPKICQYFRTRSPVTMADIDGWHARDLIAPLFFNDNTELHIRFSKSSEEQFGNGRHETKPFVNFSSGIGPHHVDDRVFFPVKTISKKIILRSFCCFNRTVNWIDGMGGL